jgi:hypothetical protein
MKKLFFIFGIVIVVLVAVITLNSCDQALTRSMGGTTKVQLESGEKLLEVTWKGDNIWYLVEPMDTDYVPKTKTFKESSRAGILEGKVIFIETR